MLLLKILFKQKGHRSKNEQPGVLGQKPLARGFEKKAHNRANQPGQQRTKFRGNIFEAISQSFAGGFQTSGEDPDDSSDCGPGSEKNSGQCRSMFFEDLFDPFQERPPPFPFRNLSLQTCDLLVSFCHSAFCGFFFGGQGILILDDCLVFLVSALQLAFLLFQVVQRFCLVEPLFNSISFTFFCREACSESVDLFLFFFFVFCLLFKHGHLFFCVF